MKLTKTQRAELDTFATNIADVVEDELTDAINYVQLDDDEQIVEGHRYLAAAISKLVREKYKAPTDQ